MKLSINWKMTISIKWISVKRPCVSIISSVYNEQSDGIGLMWSKLRKAAIWKLVITA